MARTMVRPYGDTVELETREVYEPSEGTERRSLRRSPS